METFKHRLHELKLIQMRALTCAADMEHHHVEYREGSISIKNEFGCRWRIRVNLTQGEKLARGLPSN
jgi:hypothetical protein